MATGTKYTNKAQLLSELERVKLNSTYDTTSDKIQQNDKDTVESLWDRGVAPLTLSFTELKALYDSASLEQGQVYRFEFETVHRIPGTSVLNTSSAIYSASDKEYILVKAATTSKLFPIAYSEKYFDDILYYDITKILAEDGVTARKGKIVRRINVTNNIDIPWDFRACIFRRHDVSTAAYSNYSTYVGTASLRANTAISSDELYVCSRDAESTENGASIDDRVWGMLWSNAATPYCIPSNLTTLAGIAITKGTAQDFKTFASGISGVTNIKIEETVGTHGSYPTQYELGDIVFKGTCNNIYVGPESYNVTFLNVTKSKIDVAFNSVFTSCSSITGTYASTHVNICQDVDVRVANTLISRSNYFTSGRTLGTNNYILRADACSFKNNCSGNTLTNTQQVTLDDDITDCTLDTCSNAVLSAGCVNIDIINAATNYSAKTNLYFGTGCTNILSRAALTDVYFDNGCNDFSFNRAATITKTSFGLDCQTITVNATGVLNGVSFGPKTANKTITASLSNTQYLVTEDTATETIDSTIASLISNKVKVATSTAAALTADPNTALQLLGVGPYGALSKVNAEKYPLVVTNGGVTALPSVAKAQISNYVINAGAGVTSFVINYPDQTYHPNYFHVFKVKKTDAGACTMTIRYNNGSGTVNKNTSLSGAANTFYVVTVYPEHGISVTEELLITTSNAI